MVAVIQGGSAVSRPSIFKIAAESRIVGEVPSFAFGSPLLRHWLPRGHRNVLVMPGFLAHDWMTVLLRRNLGRLGHTVHGWDLGTNLGPTQKILDGIVERLDALYKADGPVDLVGWSLGGIFARELARIAPGAVRQVITLGSPIQIDSPTQSTIAPIYEALSSHHVEHLEMRVPAHIRDPLPVPTTSVYTRSDGVVKWHLCLNSERPQAENVEVFGSHIGLSTNLSALIVVADRLALPEHTWKPFRVRRSLRGFFPTAPTYQIPEMP